MLLQSSFMSMSMSRSGSGSVSGSAPRRPSLVCTTVVVEVIFVVLHHHATLVGGLPIAPSARVRQPTLGQPRNNFAGPSPPLSYRYRYRYAAGPGGYHRGNSADAAMITSRGQGREATATLAAPTRCRRSTVCFHNGNSWDNDDDDDYSYTRSDNDNDDNSHDHYDIYSYNDSDSESDRPFLIQFVQVTAQLLAQPLWPGRIQVATGFVIILAMWSALIPTTLTVAALAWIIFGGLSWWGRQQQQQHHQQQQIQSSNQGDVSDQDNPAAAAAGLDLLALGSGIVIATLLAPSNDNTYNHHHHDNAPSTVTLLVLTTLLANSWIQRQRSNTSTASRYDSQNDPNDANRRLLDDWDARFRQSDNIYKHYDELSQQQQQESERNRSSGRNTSWSDQNRGDRKTRQERDPDWWR